MDLVDNSNGDRVPTCNALLNPTLIALHQLGGSASIREIVNQVIKNVKLPSDITQVPHGKGGQTELEYRLGWARTYLKKTGLIDNSERGVWSLTAEGRETQETDPTTVRRFVQQNRSGKSVETDEDALTEDVNDSAGDSSDEAALWREDLQNIIREMPPDTFERLFQRLLRESGFIEVEVTGKSGDGGIDGHGIIRLAGLISFPVLFQCKRYSGSVSTNVVRDFRGAMAGRADKGVILTTGTFTRDAQREATRDGAPPIDLIDGELLIDKMKELKLGVNVSSKTVEVVEVDEGWFDSI